VLSVQSCFPIQLILLFAASYGSLARFKSIQRLHPVGNSTVVGASGDLSDFQYIQSVLEELIIEEYTAGDHHSLGPNEIHEYLARVMYGRRSKMDPLWNSLVVGGRKDGKRCAHVLPSSLFPVHPSSCVTSCAYLCCSFLAYVDLLGTTYSASSIATGYGAYIAIPLLRNAVDGHENSLTEEEARKILEDCMRVLFYRDARSLNKVRALMTFLVLIAQGLVC
jgi:20S proteasome subunit beta 7